MGLTLQWLKHIFFLHISLWLVMFSILYTSGLISQWIDCSCSDSIPNYRTSLNQFALYWKMQLVYTDNTLVQTVWK